jgi:glycosyltransferase involved in cell wall biosynthesis
MFGGIQMKRILHIISQYPGNTGSGTYLQATIRELNKKSYIQGLIAGIHSDNESYPRYIGNFYPLKFNSIDIPFPIVGMSDIMPYESIKYSDLTEDMMLKWKSEFRKVIERALEEFKPDIIITHHLWIITSLIKNIAPNIKTIGVCHGTDIRQFENCPQYRQEVLQGCQQLDVTLALSEQQKIMINQLYNISLDRIKVIGGGYNGEVFYPKVKNILDDEIKIIYAGKLSYAKGVVSLIKVFEKLVSKYDVKLQLAGKGTGEEEIYIKRLGYKLGSKIEFLGELNQENLGRTFREADIFVMPSFYEGLSLVTIEALASGLFIVSTSIPGLISYLGDDINDNGIIEYVDLPEMIKVDKPLEEDLPLFHSRLQIKIEKQIARLKDGFIMDEGVVSKIKELSWENIIRKIERNF